MVEFPKESDETFVNMKKSMKRIYTPQGQSYRVSYIGRFLLLMYHGYMHGSLKVTQDMMSEFGGVRL